MSTQKIRQRNSESSSQKTFNRSEGLLITGMHRSGTSMIAGLIEKLGVHQLGKNPMPAAADNRDGFYEDVTLVKISDEILRVSDSSWDLPLIESKLHPQKNDLSESLIQTARREVFQLRQDVGEPWFIKDPRICLTVDEWKRILLLKTPLIFIVRNPHDVASSLMQRNNLEPRRALALWYRYNFALLRSVERDQILVLDYDMTCSKPGTAQARVESFLETVLSRGDNSVFEIEKQVILNPRNFSRSIDLSDTKLHKESRDCFDLYRKISQFHLKMRLTTLKLTAEPTWVEEELKIAQREAFTQNQLEELNHKAEYLFTELGQSRELITQRDNELAQLRAATEQERHKLETQLEELNHKAEYLFTELGQSRELITQRDNELAQLRAATEQERHKLETQLEELNHKAEYLFTELQGSIELADKRDNELAQLRAATEQERHKLETQLEELNHKAEYLFTELQGSIELADKRDNELAQLRAATEQERHKLETQLEELNHKAEYLFTELQGSIELADKRDNELAQLRAATEQERHKLETQLEELNHKAEYLFTELQGSIELADKRDNELAQLRADTEQERHKLETQLEELNHKAEYLFTELGQSRDQISERDKYIREIERKIDCFDKEATRMSILLIGENTRNQELQLFAQRAEILEDYLTFFIDDCRRLTSKTTYKATRKVKMIFKFVFSIFSKNKTLKNDVLPIVQTTSEIISEVIALDFQTHEYLLLNPDLKKCGINPILHYLLHGKNENRQLPIKTN